MILRSELYVQSESSPAASAIAVTYSCNLPSSLRLVIVVTQKGYRWHPFFCNVCRWHLFLHKKRLNLLLQLSIILRATSQQEPSFQRNYRQLNGRQQGRKFRRYHPAILFSRRAQVSLCIRLTHYHHYRSV